VLRMFVTVLLLSVVSGPIAAGATSVRLASDAIDPLLVSSGGLLAADPAADPMRADPRWEALLARMRAERLLGREVRQVVLGRPVRFSTKSPAA